MGSAHPQPEGYSAHIQTTSHPLTLAAVLSCHTRYRVVAHSLVAEMTCLFPTAKERPDQRQSVPPPLQASKAFCVVPVITVPVPCHLTLFLCVCICCAYFGFPNPSYHIPHFLVEIR